jgi:uncharacterized protein (DUF3084 family)
MEKHVSYENGYNSGYANGWNEHGSAVSSKMDAANRRWQQAESERDRLQANIDRANRYHDEYSKIPTANWQYVAAIMHGALLTPKKDTPTNG